MKPLSFSSPIVMSAGVAAIATCGVAAPAIAADQGSDHSNADLVSLLKAQVAPRYPSARYQDGASGRSFVLDRSGASPLLKFDDTEEVLALSVSNAQRGDEVFRNDAGRKVLVVTEIGNVIFFDQGDKRGSPAGFSTETSAVALPESSGVLPRVEAIKAQLNAVAPGIDVQVSDELSSYANWAEDALINAAYGMERALTASPDEISKLIVVFAQHGHASFEDGVLTIGVAPHKGYAGRPSSEAVALAIALRGKRS